MRELVLVLGLCGAGCTTGPYIDPCETTSRPLAPDQVSALGFSADEVVALYGDERSLEVGWVGRHSRSPPSDTIDVALGAIEGDVVETTHAPHDPSQVEAERCAERDRLSFDRTATFATRDGQVAGSGRTGFSLGDLDLDAAEIGGEASVTLSEERWSEVDLHLDDHLAPPDRAYLALGQQPGWDWAEIGVDGPNYTLAVWKCDEQLRGKGDCATWR